MRIGLLLLLVTASVIYFDDLAVKDLNGAKNSLQARKSFAQKLVDELATKHPELVRVGLHVTPPNSLKNMIIASNVPAKIGQESDPEDLMAIESGKPVVLKEGDNFDVTLTLHDSVGRIIGAIGLTFKPMKHEQETDAIRCARDIARELEKRIPSKAKLFERTK